jgi:hypothetical protein
MANEEARMRQALGLRNGPSAGGQVPQRREAEQRGRRFVKDGEVPVVVVNSSSRDDASGPVNRIAAAEHAARSERHAREQAERALSDAQSTIQQLRTQLAHAEMAHREALAAERATREVVEQALREANEARAAAEASTREAPPAAPPRRRGRPPLIRVSTRPAEETGQLPLSEPAGPVLRRRKAVAEETEQEQEPVQWWLPTYRASTRKR